MNEEQLDTILLAWWYVKSGNSIKDAFDVLGCPFRDLEEGFIALCEEHFGKDFINNWEPVED